MSIPGRVPNGALADYSSSLDVSIEKAVCPDTKFLVSLPQGLMGKWQENFRNMPGEARR